MNMRGKHLSWKVQCDKAVVTWEEIRKMWICDIGVNGSFGKEFEENRSNGMGFWLLVLIKSRARFEINGDSVEIRKPSYVLLRPDTPVIFGAIRGNMLIDWIGFSATVIV